MLGPVIKGCPKAEGGSTSAADALVSLQERVEDLERKKGSAETRELSRPRTVLGKL